MQRALIKLRQLILLIMLTGIYVDKVVERKVFLIIKFKWKQIITPQLIKIRFQLGNLSLWRGLSLILLREKK